MVTPYFAKKLADAQDKYWRPIAGVTEALRDLASQVESLQADADRLHTIFLGLNHDGFAWWLPEWCIREGEVAPTLDQMRAQIDIERAAIDAARKDQP